MLERVRRENGGKVSMKARPTLSDVTGATLVRFETADGLKCNFDDDEAARTISHGGINFRGLRADVTGDMLEPYLYRLLRLDPHRFVFDLPSSMRGTGSARSGTRGNRNQEGFVFSRGADGKASGRPVGKVIFLPSDRKFSERDPACREDFERME
jgi:hypothetical protein